MPDDGAWFRARSHGYGAGLPIAWQGWVLLGGFILAAFALGALMDAQHDNDARIAIGAGFFVLLIAFIDTARRKTRGGWKWRWGAKG